MDARSYGYTYAAADGSLTKLTLPGSGVYTYSYDGLKRLTERSLSVGGQNYMTRSYGYLDGTAQNSTTLIVGSLANRKADGSSINSYTYSYDDVGNITAISGSTNATYTYDAQGQLLTETYGGKTYTYTYDGAGNILSVSDGSTTKSYTYGDSNWKDLLTAYNGQAISYDAIGNPTSWYDGTTFGWSNGRRLTSAVNSSAGLNNSYTYDADGLRLTKTVGNEQHKYVWQGSTLVSEYYGGKTLEFFYDESGAPYGFSYKSSSSAAPAMYYYVTNLQGDVTNVLDASGSTVASYTYNAWGKVLSSSGSMASINPLRYRGYYFDSDTGLYYLKSRYYDPQIARFVNADDIVSTGQSFSGCNTFAYCGNNPVSRVDAAGHVWETVFDIVSLTFSIADVVANPANPWAWAGLAGDVADVLIPFVGGIGETVKAVGATRKLVKAETIVDVATSTVKVERVVGPYNKLRKLYKGTGMEVHHIIEKRFFNLFPEFGSKGAMTSITMLGAFAQSESESISSNVRWGKRQAMKEGKATIQYRYLYGYRKGTDGEPEIISEQAEVVRKIYDLFLSGTSIRDIKEYLEQNNIRNVDGEVKWARNAINSILTNEKYCGDVLLQKTYIDDCINKKVKKNTGQLPMYLVQNHHEGIISREIFDAAQAELARRSAGKSPSKKNAPTGRSRYSSKYALTDRLYCGECGTRYQRCTWRNHDGSKRIVWRCVSRVDYGHKYCHNSPTLDEVPLQNAILAAINKSASEKSNIVYLLNSAMEKELAPISGQALSISDIEHRLEELEAEFDNLLAEAASIEEQSTLNDRFRSILQEQTELKRKHDELQNALVNNNALSQRMTSCKRTLDSVQAMITEWDEALIRQIVDSVRVAEDNTISVTLKSGKIVVEKVPR